MDRIFQLSSSSNLELRKEALWCICNAITTSDQILTQKISDLDSYILYYLVSGTKFTSDKRLILNIIEALDKLFQLACINQSIESVKIKFEELKGFDNFEDLQRNPNYEIYNKAGEFLRRYFDEED